MANGSLWIGRIFGIDIELHWVSILFMLVLLLFQAYGLFVAWLLLIPCVLVHELSHSVTALRNKIPVSRILLLLPIGGASIIDNTKLTNPRTEFNIAVVGPLTSLFLGGVFGLLVIFTPPGPVASIVQYLFIINIALGLLNLLPAFPMDGGRVFRSYLQRKRNLYDATMITAKVSKYIMGLMVLGTIVFLFTLGNGYPFSYKELVFLLVVLTVFFLYGGVQSEEQSVLIRKRTEHLKLNDVISSNFILVSPKTKISSLPDLMKKRKEYKIITKKGDLFGIVNLSTSSNREARFASDIAIPIPNVELGTSIVDTMSAMEGNDASIAAVVKNGRLVGIVTAQHLQAFISLYMIKGKHVKNK